MAVTEDPSGQQGTATVAADAPPPSGPGAAQQRGGSRQGRRDRERGKDGAKALIDAFTMQQRRNARQARSPSYLPYHSLMTYRYSPRGDAVPPPQPEPDSAVSESTRNQVSLPPRLPRGSRASAQLERVRGARAAANASSGPSEERTRGASAGPGDRVSAPQQPYDPEFDRGGRGPADEPVTGRGRGGRGRGAGKLFNPDLDFVPARRPSEGHESRRGDDRRRAWPMDDRHAEDSDGPFYPHDPRFGHPPPPPPHHYHPGFGHPPPHHRGPFPPPPFHGQPPGPYGPPPPFGQAFNRPEHHQFLGPQGSHPHEHYSGQQRPFDAPYPRPHSPAARDSPGAGSINGSSAAGKQLYDPRRDDPVRFASSKRGNADSKSAASGSVVSKGKKKEKEAGSSSGKSKSSKGSKTTGAQNDLPAPGEEESRQSDGSNSYVKKLKSAYKVIADLEKALKDEESSMRARDEELKLRDRDTGRIVPTTGGGDMRLVGHKRSTDDYWVKLAKQHQQLAEAHRHFLDMALDPRLPESLHSLPQKYNIPVRLWQTAFHQLLERLRHALPAISGQTAERNAESSSLIEHMVDFIYYAYGFYTGLLGEPSFVVFRSAWIEQLGDLARYRMAVASLSAKYSAKGPTSGRRTLSEAGSEDDEDDKDDDAAARDGSSDSYVAHVKRTMRKDEAGGRIDEEAKTRDGGSIGVAALNDWEYEEQETWRNTARDWYAKGLAETPAVGRLHHHLALLSKGDELRALYHYVKSLTAPHPYLPARESVLPFFEAEHQSRRTRSEVSLNELFVHLHGMLFTKIQLDDFDDELARFLELLAQERLLLSKHGVTGHNVTPESAWIMMAVVNVAAVLQYGADDSVLGRLLTGPAAPSHQKKAGPRAPAPRPQAILLNTSKKDIPDTTSDVGGDEEVGEDMVKSLAGVSLNDGDEDPLTFRLAARLCFSMLEELLRRPLRPSISGTLEAVSPYITVVLTFLAQVGQRADALRRLERFLPWPNLINLFNKIPKDVDIRGDQHGFRLAGGPLPEDWCMRGMEWSGRTMFARGYFKPKSNRAKGRNDIQAVAESETDVLALSCEADDDYTSDGVIEPDGDVDPDVLVSNLSVARWRRVAVVAGWATTPRGVSGLAYDPSVPKFAILASLRTKISRWKEEAKQEAEAKKAVVHKRIAADAADPDDIEILDSEDEDVDDAGDSDVVKGLKARRRELRATIRAARAPPAKQPSGPVSRSKPATRVPRPTKPTVDLVPGYTILVFDTNILVGMLSILRDLLEARRWTLIIPLAVVTELDGLKVNPPPLGKDASDALRFLEATIRDPSTRSQSKYLKVQTSRGNYLQDLSIRSEAIDFSGNAVSTSNARNMDDLVLRAAVWQDEHFSDRSAIVHPSVDRSLITPTTAKVALVTFDRGLRLKAHARGIVAADEKDIARLLSFRDQG